MARGRASCAGRVRSATRAIGAGRVGDDVQRSPRPQSGVWHLRCDRRERRRGRASAGWSAHPVSVLALDAVHQRVPRGAHRRGRARLTRVEPRHDQALPGHSWDARGVERAGGLGLRVLARAVIRLEFLSDDRLSRCKRVAAGEFRRDREPLTQPAVAAAAAWGPQPFRFLPRGAARRHRPVRRVPAPDVRPAAAARLQPRQDRSGVPADRRRERHRFDHHHQRGASRPPRSQAADHRGRSAPAAWRC